MFDHERHRAQLALIMQLAEITATGLLLSWASAIRMSKSQCFQIWKEGNSLKGRSKLHSRKHRATWRKANVRCSLLRSLRCDGRFGWTAYNSCGNEFGIPDVPNETCLLLCPHLNLLILIVTDQAFATPELTPP